MLFSNIKSNLLGSYMLNVVFASNNDYSSLLSTCLISLLENNKKDFDCINVFVLDDGISEENKQKIFSLAKNYSCKLTFIKTDILNSNDKIMMPLDKEDYGKSLTTYYRLFLSTLLPDDIDKVIYLDCDALVLGSYKELWKLDISDYYCAGVVDPTNDNILREYGFGGKDKYFNAGFLLVNLEMWRNNNIEEKFIEFLLENKSKFFLHDQGVINNVLRSKIKIVEPKYNLQLYFQFFDYDLAMKYMGREHSYYTKEIVDESRNNPVFLHFCGGTQNRPWYNKEHIYYNEFKKYSNMADCKNIYDNGVTLSWKTKLLYKGINNKFFQLILKLIPGKIIKNMVDKNGINYYRKECLNAAEFDNK